MKVLFPILALIALTCVYGSQEKVSISRGFFTGKEYLDMSETERRAYATGAINGMLVSPFFGAPQDRVEWLKSCSARLSDVQTAEILSRYITDNPEKQNDSLNVLTFNAMRGACVK